MNKFILYSLLISVSVFTFNCSNNTSPEKNVVTSDNSFKVTSNDSKSSTDDIVKQIDEKAESLGQVLASGDVETEKILIAEDSDRESGLNLSKEICKYIIENNPEFVVLNDKSTGDNYNESYSIKYYLDSKNSCYLIENLYELKEGTQQTSRTLKLYFKDSKPIYCKLISDDNSQDDDSQDIKIIDVTKMNTINTRELNEINEGIDIIKSRCSDIDLTSNKIE